VIGVMPSGIDFPGGVRCYVPLALEVVTRRPELLRQRDRRLKPASTAAQGEADLLRAHQPIFDTRGQGEDRFALRRTAARDWRADFRTSARALAGAVGLLLVVA
jgi:hypothetical protein